MKRGRIENAAEVLIEALAKPGRAPTRIMAATGVQYYFLECMLRAGLVEAVKTGRRRRKLVVTQKGREFLAAYKICDQLFPESCCSCKKPYGIKHVEKEN
jgi:predicted transcriptional regulator